MLSDNIECYPTPTTSNNYDNWGPIANIAVVVKLPIDGPTYVKCLSVFNKFKSTGVFFAGYKRFSAALHLLCFPHHWKKVTWIYMAFGLNSLRMEYTNLMFFTDRLFTLQTAS